MNLIGVVCFHIWLWQRNPEIASAVLGNDIELFQRLLRQQHQRRLEIEQQQQEHVGVLSITKTWSEVQLSSVCGLSFAKNPNPPATSCSGYSRRGDAKPVHIYSNLCTCTWQGCRACKCSMTSCHYVHIQVSYFVRWGLLLCSFVKVSVEKHGKSLSFCSWFCNDVFVAKWIGTRAREVLSSLLHRFRGRSWGAPPWILFSEHLFEFNLSATFLPREN